MRGRGVVRAAGTVALGLASLTACTTETAPSRPPIAVTVPSPAEARADSCAECPDSSPTIVIDIPVTVSDVAGPGGVVAQVTTIVLNRSRGLEIARNVRPNADYAFPDSSLPVGGQLSLRAGVVAPLPPPRDEMALTVHVRLTDGRDASATVPLHVVFPS
jgi:hypothetical protein